MLEKNTKKQIELVEEAIQVLGDVHPDLPNRICNLGTSTNQWNNVYSKGYYYNGVAWGLDKANTWTVTNNFSTLSVFSNSVTYNEAPSSTVELPSIRILGGGRYAGAFDYIWRSTGENVIRLSLGSYKSDGTFGYWSCNFGVPRDFSDGGKFGTPAFYPNTNGYDLGTSTNKWKTLNGVNPGALSLPDNSVYYSFNTDNFVYTGAYNEVTVPKKGWLYLRLVECNQDAYIACSSSIGNVDYPVFSMGTILNQNTGKYEVNFLMSLSMTTFRLYIYKTQGTLTQHKVFYTEGMIQ